MGEGDHLDDEDRPTQPNERVSEAERRCAVAFLNGLKANGTSLREFADDKQYANRLTKIRHGATLRLSVLAAMKTRAAEKGIPFPTSAPLPLEDIIRSLMGTSGHAEFIEEWSGSYALFTRLRGDDVGVARLKIGGTPNGLGFPYFRIIRNPDNRMLIRGWCFEKDATIYLLGFSYSPSYPRLITFNAAPRNKNFLTGVLSASSSSDVSFTSSCVAVCSDQDPTGIKAGVYTTSVINQLRPKICKYLLQRSPFSVSRDDPMG